MALPAPVGRQHEVVYLPSGGHHVVLGTAGTGKTVMAIHRAAHLADPRTTGAGPVLLLTFTKSLVTYLHHLAAGHSASVTVETYHRFARGYLSSQGLMGYDEIAGADLRRALIDAAVHSTAAGYKPSPTNFFDRPGDFFNDELGWIDGNGLQTLDEYLAAPRVGRMAALLPGQRRAVWQIRKQYLAGLAASNRRYDWPGLATAVRAALANDVGPRLYRHIVLDEAQDLSPEAIRSTAEAVQLGGSLTLFGDYAQQLYGQRISWRSCGLAVTREERFVDNYRNTREIAQLALAMSQMPHFRDTADLVEPKAPDAAGAKPTLARCHDVDEETKLVREQAAELGKYARVGILTRTRSEARQASRGLPNVRILHDDMGRWDDSLGIYTGTYHSAKGLEFDVVILPYCSAARLPDSEVLAAFGPEEAAARESRLLYVAVTRARRELLITYQGALTPLLPPTNSDLYTTTP